jgi:hypothetical protein
LQSSGGHEDIPAEAAPNTKGAPNTKAAATVKASTAAPPMKMTPANGAADADP